MFLSVFDIFKVGVGPSSSHTMGPMLAAGRFLDALRAGADRVPGSGAPARLGCRLHGSLAFTGKGHATDRAVILGLAGFDAAGFRRRPRRRGARPPSPRPTASRPPGLPELAFDPERDLVFDYGPPLPGHANGLVLSAYDAAGNLHLPETYYSIGGGFVLTARELERPPAADAAPPVPYPFRTAAEMLAHGRGLRAQHRRPAAGQRADAPPAPRRSSKASRGSGR